MTSGLGGRGQARATIPILAATLSLLLAWWAYPSELPLWRSLAIITGWVGTVLIVVSAALMVREPHLARALGGLENCYAWHHRTGVLGYLLLLVHPLALALDGWQQSPRTAWQSLAPWLQAWPVWLGWVALLLLMIGLTATFATRLSYRRWRRLHTLLGFGVLLAFCHIAVLLGEPAPWLAIPLLGILALLWRIVAADLGWVARPYRVMSVTQRATGIIEASVSPCAAALPVSPGQFVLAAFSAGAHFRGCGEYHPFTVSGIEAGHRLRLTVKALGRCSQHLQALEPGVLVRLQGPFGQFLSDRARGPELWIAGGIGITPFIAALRAEPRTQFTTLVYFYKTDADAAFLDELLQCAAADSKFELIAHATGDHLPDIEPMLAKVTRLSERKVYLCGPQAMVDMLAPRLIERGVPPGSIHFERFDFRQ